ncbi:SIS domain-containing protein [Phytomonospora sp. NPDC050363]|uniref:MurR/RpiR family transcriptional regulator n=1 Tax=Phytomonospora sp. NPDC050363 TaxID=3155642 RepID=UPI00340FDD0A
MTDGLAERLLAAADGVAAEKLAALIVENYPHLDHLPPARLLRQAKATPRDLDRLLAAAGVADYTQLRELADREEDRSLSSPDARYGARIPRRSSADSLMRQVIEHEQANLRHTLDAVVASGSVELAAGKIVAARRRFVIGGGKSGAYASLVASDLSASMAGVSLVDGNALAPVDLLSDVRASDVLIAFSFRRYARTTLIVAEEFQAAGGTLIGVTDSRDSRLAGLSDIPVIVSTGSASYADSPTAVAAVCHLLVTLAAASAKGARRRLARRDELAARLDAYEEA